MTFMMRRMIRIDDNDDDKLRVERYTLATKVSPFCPLLATHRRTSVFYGFDQDEEDDENVMDNENHLSKR